MADTPIWMIVPGNAPLSVLLLAVLAMPLLYVARWPVHSLVHALEHLARSPLRLVARWLVAAAAEMRERNRQVLLAHGREEVQQHIAREFERIAAMVRRDLEGFPALQRRLLDEITRVEEDYRKSGEVPPPPPEWVEAVAAIANVKNGNELVQRLLDEINLSIKEMHEATLDTYREACEERHRILNGFMPFWRSLDKTLARAADRMTSLGDRAAHLDAQMAKFEEIVRGTEKAEHALTVSQATQFLVSLVVLFIAAGGALINFKLIALPMSEMVGAGDWLTPSLRTSEIAALVIIFVEATMGLFLMETLRITHLFPRIHNLGEAMRKRMMAVSFVLLLALAGVEAALALMRDMLIADKMALLQSLASAPQPVAADGVLSRIPTAGQMLLGFILPFALAFVAIPLESFVNSARTVGGALLVLAARGTAFALRLAGNVLRNLARVLIMFYDLVIVLPLLLERLMRAKSPESKPADEAPLLAEPDKSSLSKRLAARGR